MNHFPNLESRISNLELCLGSWVLGAGVMALGVWAFCLWTAERIVEAEPTAAGFARALRWNPRADAYHAMLGNSYRNYLKGQDLDRSVRELRQAIAIRPRAWTHYQDLAVTQELRGDFAAAEAAFRQAVSLNPHHTQLRWQVANYYLRRQDLPRAMSAFRAAVELDPGRLTFAANRLNAIGASVENIGAHLVPARRPDLLTFLYFVLQQLEAEPRRAGRLAWETWQKWVSAPAVEPFQIGSLFSYIQYLIRTGELEKAGQVWRAGLAAAGLRQTDDGAEAADDPAAGFVFNSGFETPALNGGLDWVLPNHPEVCYEYDHEIRVQGGESLRIDFAGKSNLDFHGPRETVLLPAGRLQLSFVIRTENITSDQGICLEVRSWVGNALLARSEAARGTRPWTRMTQEFTLNRPGAAYIVVRRYPSGKPADTLSGKVWLDEVDVKQNSKFEIRDSRLGKTSRDSRLGETSRNF